MVRATDSVTLQTLKDIKTMNFDEETGLEISSEDGTNKVVIDDDSVDIYTNGNKSAEFTGSKISLGMDDNGEGSVEIDLLNGFGGIKTAISTLGNKILGLFAQKGARLALGIKDDEGKTHSAFTSEYHENTYSPASPVLNKFYGDTAFRNITGVDGKIAGIKWYCDSVTSSGYGASGTGASGTSVKLGTGAQFAAAMGLQSFNGHNGVIIANNGDGDAKSVHVESCTYVPSVDSWFAVLAATSSGKIRISYVAIGWGDLA